MENNDYEYVKETISELSRAFMVQDENKALANEHLKAAFSPQPYLRKLYPDATLYNYSEVNLQLTSFNYLSSIAEGDLKEAVDRIKPIIEMENPNGLLSYSMLSFLFNSLLDPYSKLFSPDTYTKLESYILNFALELSAAVRKQPDVFFLARIGFINAPVEIGAKYSKITKFMNYLVYNEKARPYAYVSGNKDLEALKQEIALKLYDGKIQEALQLVDHASRENIRKMYRKIIMEGHYA